MSPELNCAIQAHTLYFTSQVPQTTFSLQRQTLSVMCLEVKTSPSVASTLYFLSPSYSLDPFPFLVKRKNLHIPCNPHGALHLQHSGAVYFLQSTLPVMRVNYHPVGSGTFACRLGVQTAELHAPVIN